MNPKQTFDITELLDSIVKRFDYYRDKGYGFGPALDISCEEVIKARKNKEGIK